MCITVTVITSHVLLAKRSMAGKAFSTTVEYDATQRSCIGDKPEAP